MGLDDMHLIRASAAGVSPSGHRKFNAGRGEFQALSTSVVGTEGAIQSWVIHYRDLWQWCLDMGYSPPAHLQPPT